ncbi:ATP-dependent DNA helicase DinG [Halobacillus kuroshimensis]|uniref:3'-5' exonuclease DinG n=1 Tax=Halobacillus kuroshimensis TaxID=302481 RepID=A0ABS3DTW5_9BACI|nr:ATP-dependent DNA helicase DinG [Halobacillus kuroshimensis]MBN8234653.1 ATP-dependent DNA helicase DinG [Halobacillus kuroshimensis]
MTTFAIVDLETTGNASPKGDRIIEIGIVLMNEAGSVIREFSSLIYPERDIPPFITSLTGIDEEDVMDAPLFSEIAGDIHPLFKDAYIVAHNIEFDLGFLNDELQRCGFPRLHNPIIDTVELARIMLPTSSAFKLGHLAEKLDMGHDRPHRALSDAQVTADLLQYLLKQMQALPERTLSQLLKIEGKLKSDLRTFIESAVEEARYRTQNDTDIEILYGIAVRSRRPDEVRSASSSIFPPFEQWNKEVYEGENGLKSMVPEYEIRKGQQEMTSHVHKALEENRHAVIEAGAGTGKSAAYLLPAVYHAVKNDERILITTHTNSLQKQLLEEEIPKIERMFPRPIRAVLYKGKGHYISLIHFQYELERSYQDNYDTALTKAMLLVWLTKTRTGDIDEVQLPSNGRQFWHKVSAEQSSKTEQLGYTDDSFFQWALRRAEEADIIITNHALFCLDIIKEETSLPSYDRAVVDEAHHLEAVAGRYFGLRMNYRDLQRYLTQTTELAQKSLYKGWPVPQSFYSHLNKLQKAVDEAKEELSQFSRYIYQHVKKQRNSSRGRSDVGRTQMTLEKERSASFMQSAKEMSNRFLSAVFVITEQMTSMQNELQILLTLKEDHGIPILLSRIHTQKDVCLDIRHQLIDYFDSQDEESVRWIEIEGEGAANSIYLYSEPLNTPGILKERLFNQKKSVVLTSATLTTGDSFKYIRDSLGLGDEPDVIETSIPSPYPFHEQVQLLVPDDFPDIKNDPDTFIEALSEAIYSTAHVTNGRMMVLFTSYDMLRRTYSLLKEFIDPEEFMIFAQGISSGSRDRLKKNFQAFDQAILLGTSSFWEGVDIPGDDLSCLMMVRLPFAPPDQPVQKSIDQRLKQEGKNAFMEKSLPQAIIRFKQGFGRLIRSSSDRGVVIVCDQRLMEAKYGKYFLSSLPDIPVVYDSTKKLMDRIENWL